MAVQEQARTDINKEGQPSPTTMQPMKQPLGNTMSGLASALVSNIVPIASRNEMSLGMDSDSMVAKFKEMVLKQQEFASGDRPCYVDIGYHWTDTSKMDSIRVRGLLTRAELESRRLAAAINHKNCVKYGDGIYIAENPTSQFSMGTMTCLMVARVKGRQGVSKLRTLARSELDDVIKKFDTIVGVSSWEKVLKSSEQCVPLVCFDSAALKEDEQKIFKVQLELQSVLDLLLNGGDEIPVDNWTRVAKAPLPPPPFRGYPSGFGVFAKPGKLNPFRKKRKEKKGPKALE